MSEPIAIVSDIHSNLEALTRVLEDIEKRGVKKIICLGDIIGYGPNPRECLKLAIERFHFSLCGNHEWALYAGPIGFSDNATAAINWTKQQLFSNSYSDEENKQFRDFINSLKPVKEENDVMFSHASPIDPLVHYLLPLDVFNTPLMTRIFSKFNRICLLGHTHVPGVFTQNFIFYQPEAVGNVFKIDKNSKVIINVGSVGQPRDGNPQASYGIFYGDAIEFVRLDYDNIKTRDKILNIPDLPSYLGDRLLNGV